MDLTYLQQIAHAVFRELVKYKMAAVALFVVVSFAVLAIGYVWPKSYVTSAVLYADTSNIIKPLLEGRAAVTPIDRSQQAQDSIYTRRVLEQVGRKVGLLNDNQLPNQQDNIISSLRSHITITNEGKNFFSISYSNSSPDRSFEVLNTLVDVFIHDTAESKRQESRNAYQFIDQQVKQYQAKLRKVENRLKNFKANNTAGTQHSVDSRINDLQLQIEKLKLDMDDSVAKKQSIEQQLQHESQHIADNSKLDALNGRLATMQQQLDTLRLTYKETYPDIVSLKEQMAKLQQQINAIQSGGAVASGGSNGSDTVNPLYQQLRIDLSNVETQINAQRKRLTALNTLLKSEQQRAKQVAANQADLSELNRDYSVTKEMYEEMLKRKEMARLSMTLDVEGQGVNYKIQEPATFPLLPSGLRFIHFAIIGPLLGLLAPIGLAAAYVVLDPRVRFAATLQERLPKDIQLLGVVPHINTPLAKRMFRVDMLIVAAVAIIAIGLYVGLATTIFTGKL